MNYKFGQICNSFVKTHGCRVIKNISLIMYDFSYLFIKKDRIYPVIICSNFESQFFFYTVCNKLYTLISMLNIQNVNI
jgi:hypothetical protein